MESLGHDGPARATSPVTVAPVSDRRNALRPLWSQVYIPNVLIVTGQGAMLPVLALAATHVGATTAVASVVVAMNGVGTMLFDIPAGKIVARLGEVRSSHLCAALLGIGLVVAYFATDPIVLCIGVLVAACGWSLWTLVRITHLTRAAPPELRGRALALFGGVTRLGNVVGPFILIRATSSADARYAFVIFLAGSAVGFGWLAIFRNRDDVAAFATRNDEIRPLTVLRGAKREFATAGVGTFGIALLRASRQAIVPLWGLHIGLSVGQVSLIFALSSIVDLAGFYPAGIVSDRYGRKVVAVPCIVFLSLGHALVPLTHSFSTLLLVAVVLGGGNGLGSGIIMTLGADRAPDVGRASVLAVWRFVGDGGTASGPLVDAGVIAGISLAFVGPFIAILGGVTAVVVGVFMEDPSRHVRVLTAVVDR